MSAELIRNIMAFMERASLTGKEAPAWCEAYLALKEQLKMLSNEPN